MEGTIVGKAKDVTVEIAEVPVVVDTAFAHDLEIGEHDVAQRVIAGARVVVEASRTLVEDVAAIGQAVAHEVATPAANGPGPIHRPVPPSPAAPSA
ncbi:MAG: hypothetical protein L3K09_04670 [Thermoplasmata archaeon]|nr:hypothetical protein [Thermoplasmata archaeon]